MLSEIRRALYRSILWLCQQTKKYEEGQTQEDIDEVDRIMKEFSDKLEGLRTND
jgi:hypothetical protein